MIDFNPQAIINHVYSNGSSIIKVVGFDGEGNQRVAYVDVDENNNEVGPQKTMNKSMWNRKNYQDMTTDQNYGDLGHFNSSTSHKSNVAYTIEVDENGQLIIRNSDGVKIISENIKGPKGQSGEIGPQGPTGDSGNDGMTWTPRITDDGLSLYFVNDNGERTTPYRFKGEQGESGSQGPAGPAGQDADLWKPQVSSDGKYVFFVNQRGEESEKYLVQGTKGDRGETGATGPVGPEGPVFIPSVNTDGEISWSNNGNLPNPTPINIRGSKGDTGENGAVFHPVIVDGYLTWTNDKGLPNPDPVKISGPQGVTGEKGNDGRSAYQIWLDNGNLGTEIEFLESLKGEKGDAAEQISTGYLDVEDYNCPVQLINTDLIASSAATSESPEEIIEKRIKEIEDLRKQGHTSDMQKQMRVGWFKKRMWWCAGADRDLLTMCPGDHSKYVGIGTVILFTALMAFFSSFIAMRLVFGVSDEKIWSPYSIGPAVFAFFWGSMIFFLDRFITNTMYSDGKVTISKQEFFSGLPRIVIAIFLGIVISAPLELMIFEKEIEIETTQKRDADLKNQILSNIEYQTLANEFQRITNSYEIERNKLNAITYEMVEYDEVKLKQIGQSQIDTITGDTIPGKTTYEKTGNKLQRRETPKEFENRRKNQQDIVDSLRQQYNSLEKKVNDCYSNLETKYKNEVEVGLAENLKALHNIPCQTAVLLIMLLFILIDISPVLYKMMLADGKYDNYLHQEKLLAQDKIRLSLSKMLKKLDDSELKRVAPFIMGDIYEKMAGDSYVFKTEEEFKDELERYQHKSKWWGLWPLSWIRWIFYKEQKTPSSPVIIFNSKEPSDQELRINDVNEEVFEEVLDMKRRIILASYRRWYKRQHDNILGDRVDDENAGREPFDDSDDNEE